MPGANGCRTGEDAGPHNQIAESLSVKPDRCPQTPTDAQRYRQVPTDPPRSPQAQTDIHSSPPFKKRIRSLPQSLIVFRSRSEENNYSVIVTQSGRKDRRTVIWVIDFI